jgi:hypothetical protein
VVLGVRLVSSLFSWWSIAIADIIASASIISITVFLNSRSLLLKHWLGNIVLVSKPHGKLLFSQTRWCCRHDYALGEMEWVWL